MREISSDGDSRPPQGARLYEVDALRALALLGILSVNIWFFAYPETLETGMRSTARETPADQIVSFAGTVLFEAKSYVVFSFLFGLAFVLQWASASRAGVSETGRSFRRFAALAVLGLLHGILLFAGDILLAYAILGCALFGMRRIRPRWAVLTGVVVLLAIPLFLLTAGLLTAGMQEAGMQEAAALAGGGDAEAARAAYTGGLSSYLAFQLEAYSWALPNVLLGQGPMALAAFLIGLAVGRTRMIERILSREIPTGRLIAWMTPALGVGFGLSWIAAVMLWGPPGSTAPAGATSEDEFAAEMIGQGLVFLAGPIQALGYVLGALLVLRSPVLRGLMQYLSFAGRMSLSNYLGQSALLVMIFSGLGLGLGGELSAVAVAGVAVLLWVFQLSFSAAWLRNFRRGPMEGLVRAVTYREAPSWR